MFEEILSKFAVGYDPAVIDTCATLFLTAFKEGLYAIAYLVYMLFAKIILAASNTPDSKSRPVYSKVYKAMELSVLVFGKVKQKPGEAPKNA